MVPATGISTGGGGWAFAGVAFFRLPPVARGALGAAGALGGASGFFGARFCRGFRTLGAGPPEVVAAGTSAGGAEVGAGCIWPANIYINLVVFL